MAKEERGMKKSVDHDRSAERTNERTDGESIDHAQLLPGGESLQAVCDAVRVRIGFGKREASIMEFGK